MKRGPTGRFAPSPPFEGERVRAFVPFALPPVPPLDVSGPLREAYDAALLSIGRLDSVSLLLPDTALLLYTFLRKEAVLSSQIEGTQSSLSDLLLFELDSAPGAPLEDVRETSRYVNALEHGMRRLAEHFPLSNRLIRELHAALLSRGRGSDKSPGEFRSTQNWIGGLRPGLAHFVPPPPEEVPVCMAKLERFLNDRPTRTPTLIKAALAHVQFETIHPFLDGNGRVGRMLIPMIMVSDGLLKDPLLYLSVFFKQHRAQYYELLQAVRTSGDWENWLAFFLEGVRATAVTAIATARALATMFQEDRRLIQNLSSGAGSALRVHESLQKHPIQTISSLSQSTQLTIPTVTAALARLAKCHLVEELTGKQRGKVYGYRQYLKILESGPLGESR